MAELPGDIQVARVRAIVNELFIDARVVGDDGPRLSSEGVDCVPLVEIRLPWTDAEGHAQQQSLAVLLDKLSATDNEDLVAQLVSAARRAEERCGGQNR
jgi:hypothetical protein